MRMNTHARDQWTRGTPGFGVSRRERSVCVVETQVHARASIKNMPRPYPNRLVGCCDRGPVGCCGNPSPLLGNSRENQHIYSLKNICMCTLALFFMLFVALSSQAGISPVTFAKDMNKISSQHVTPCNGNEGYPLPTWAVVATGDTYPGGGDCKIPNAIAFEDPTHSRSDGAKAPIAIHI